MPAYNARPYIAEAISSVLDQDYPNIELIVIDDGSIDGTAECAESFGDWVKVIRQANAGVAAARNKGLAEARGALIAFLDADDLWLPGKLAAQVEYLHLHPDTAVVYGVFSRWHTKPDGSFDSPPAPVVKDPQNLLVVEHSGWIYTELLFDNIVHIITAMIRKEVVEKLGGFDESLPTGEDYDFWLRMSRHFKADKLNRVLAYYRMNASSITRTPRAENNEYLVLQKALDQYGLVGQDGASVADKLVKRRMFQLCFSHGYLHFWSGGNPCVALKAFQAAKNYSGGGFKIAIYIFLTALKCAFFRHR
jgi:glycosyltransferase involved in cell wall biosynthesis